MLQQAARYISHLLFSSHINAYVKKKKKKVAAGLTLFIFFFFITVLTVECLHTRNIKQISKTAESVKGMFPLSSDSPCHP